MKTRVYYHNADLDGLCSGAIAYLNYGESAEYCGVNYGDPIDLDPKLDLILFVDFAPQPWPNPVLENVFVIDHHKTSIGLPGIINTKFAACELVWDYFQLERRPLAVTYIGSADTWRKTEDWITHIVPFCVALQTEWPDIKNPLWVKLFSDPSILPYMIHSGSHMLKYSRAQYARLANDQAYQTYFAGYAAAVIIGGDKGSSRFGGYEHNCQIMVVVQKVGTRFWRYHLYSRDDGPDVSEIAKSFGGGGHKHAAGFQHEDLLV